MSDPTNNGADERQETILPEVLVTAARRVVEANRAVQRTVAVAESCTGGLVGAALTEIPGSSDVLLASIVAYADEAKTGLLGLGEDIVTTFGSVSVATAWAMARGMMQRSGADVAVAITGIAGPDGGTEKKPVGTVIFAKAVRGSEPDDIVSDKRFFGDIGRGGVRLQAALCALELLMPDESA